MQVKNISARGWWIAGRMLPPGAEDDFDVTTADVGGNPDLEIVGQKEEVTEEKKRGRPAKTEE